MELITKKTLHLLAGRSNLPLAEEIAAHLGVKLGEPNLSEFANGEIHSKLRGERSAARTCSSSRPTGPAARCR